MVEERRGRPLGKIGRVGNREKQTEGPSERERKRKHASRRPPHRDTETPGAQSRARKDWQVAAFLPRSLSDVCQTPRSSAPTYV